MGELELLKLKAYFLGKWNNKVLAVPTQEVLELINEALKKVTNNETR